MRKLIGTVKAALKRLVSVLDWVENNLPTAKRRLWKLLTRVAIILGLLASVTTLGSCVA